MTTTELDAPPVAVLSVQMQTYAQGYIDARKRAGYAWLDMGRFLSEARAEAKHGEWSVFLEATQTGEDSAKRLIAIYAQSLHDPRFADAMRANFLSVATGYELISAPADVQARLLSSDTPPTQRQIRDEKQAAKSAAPPTLEVAPFWQSLSAHHPTAHLWTRERPDLWRSACGIVTQNRAPSGSTEAGHCSSCVRATWPQNQGAPAEPNNSTDRTIPADLKGWHWLSGAATAYQLTNGDYQTRVYDHPHHAIVGARNYLASQQPEGVIPHLPPDFADIQKRAAAIGLFVAMDMRGTFSIKNDRGSGVDQIAEWDSLLRHLAYSEQAAAEIAAERSARQVSVFTQPGISLSMDLQKQLVSAGASIGGDGTVYAPRGSGEPSAILTIEQAEAALIRWAAITQSPAPTEAQRASDDSKRRIVEILNRIAPLIKHIKTEDFEGLSQAIADLNECQEGTEARHWLNVGYALCDVEP